MNRNEGTEVVAAYQQLTGLVHRSIVKRDGNVRRSVVPEWGSTGTVPDQVLIAARASTVARMERFSCVFGVPQRDVVGQSCVYRTSQRLRRQPASCGEGQNLTKGVRSGVRSTGP